MRDDGYDSLLNEYLPEETVMGQEANFDGLRVVAFESRRADETARLIEKCGGEAFVSPSMREVAVEDNSRAVEAANLLITGQLDVVLIMTGVGFTHWLNSVEKSVDRQRFLNSLADCITVARGPKPVAAMKEVGLTPTHRVPEPNTWRDMLQTIDQHLQIANQNVCLQEYGKTNASLVAGLEARGARVFNLSVYKWDYPEDTAPLEKNIDRLADGNVDVVMFTSAQQLYHVLEFGEKIGRQAELVNGLRKSIIASIGPTTSEALRDAGFPVDFEPSHPKLGHLVAETAANSQRLTKRKEQVRSILTATNDNIIDRNAAWYDSPFMRACRLEPTDVTPIWMMRQAGRYMAEYREVRAKTSFLELCKNPQLCSEVMVTAVNKLGVDAAIIFSDLLPILEPMGLDLEYAPGDGPLIHNPVRESTDIDRVMELENADSLHFVIETVRQTRSDLPDHIPLIGFAGSPFTLASYVIEGGASRNYLHTKTLMFRDEGAWKELMERFVRSITVYVNAQVAAGAQCIQLFDSWAGCLGPDEYKQYVLPYLQEIIAGIVPGVPVINFATGNPALLPLLAQGGSSVVGIDWRVRLDDAWATVGHSKAVQGNLDPCTLLAGVDQIRERARDVLQQADGRPGHIFNLGHGILQQTPVENAIALVDIVHELSQR
ncbi:MAG: uroporphyrinogen decarboxylase [Planctomycetales bacterium]|nr:uroporphyrinogen decarboxylase [Planctomycetales bacterium]